MKYRNQIQIVADLLHITSDSGRDGVQVSKLMTKSKMSYGSISKTLRNLTGAGLINKIEYDGKNTFIITEKGRLYLQEYKKFADMAGAFGLDL